MTPALEYRGRFAPSPTGPLHRGSLLAAVASYLDARACKGRWLLRIEDIDPPREVPGSADLILQSLESHALEWDEPVLYQSTRSAAYNDALQQLKDTGRLFPCCCTRAILGPSGSCGRRCHPSTGDLCSQRVEIDACAGFEDGFLGEQIPDPQKRDIVLKRKDGLFSYALAVVVDDAFQEITRVVRGRDLLHQTQAQRELSSYLGYPIPAYAHIPIIVDTKGVKLSKQAGAQAIDDRQPLENVREALQILGQDSASFPAGTVSELLSLAAEHWRPDCLQKSSDAIYPSGDKP